MVAQRTNHSCSVVESGALPWLNPHGIPVCFRQAALIILDQAITGKTPASPATQVNIQSIANKVPPN